MCELTVVAHRLKEFSLSSDHAKHDSIIESWIPCEIVICQK